MGEREREREREREKWNVDSLELIALNGCLFCSGRLGMQKTSPSGRAEYRVGAPGMESGGVNVNNDYGGGQPVVMVTKHNNIMSFLSR